MIDIAVKLSEPKPSIVFDTYWRFAAERQATYFRRLRGDAVLTADPIIAAHRFTNCYRAADRVSQYLIRNVIYAGDQSPKEVVFRTLLFKIFNKISTWELFDLHGGVSILETLNEAKAVGKTLYSAAYVMPSPGNAASKHRAHLALLDDIMVNWESIAAAPSLEALYKRLLSVNSFGPFLAFQLAIDLNYSTVVNFDENDFIVPGPGARDGLKKCFTDFGDYSEADVIRWVCERADQEFARLGLTFYLLWGRKLHLIDCQNLFCEIDKYSRVAHPEIAGLSGRTQIKQKYKRDAEAMPQPVFPPKWGIK